MVGILIITHCRLAEELLSTAEFIVGKIPQAQSLCLDPTLDAETLRRRIEAAIRNVDDGDGVLVMVDMLGGTPSNLSLSFLDPERLEVISGVNLPMLMKVARRPNDESLKSIAQGVLTAGQRSISLASGILYQKLKQGNDAL